MTHQKKKIVYFFYTFNFHLINIERSSFPNLIILDFSNIKIMSKVQKQRVQTFGRKKTATAVAVCQQGKKIKTIFHLINDDYFVKVTVQSVLMVDHFILSNLKYFVLNLKNQSTFLVEINLLVLIFVCE